MITMKKTVLCLFGGKSTEYKVSLRSVCTVLDALDTEKYDIVRVGITEDGRWYHYTGSDADILADTWHQNPAVLRRAMLSSSYGDHNLYVERMEENCFDIVGIDVVIPMVHGAYCEDGTLQGLLSMTGIPYVGPHCAASAVAMDKVFTKLILNNFGIPQAKCAVLMRSRIDADPAGACEEAEAVSGYPLFVKPANAGSSIGVSKAESRDDLLRALRHAASYDDKVLVEECIVGREVECAVLGNESPAAAIPGEINAGAAFYDYDAKYITDTSSDYIPARISEKALEAVRGYAIRIYEILGCKGCSRVDFFVTEKEDIIFNEINTLPGFTSISMYPKMWQNMGKSIPALLDDLIALAEEAGR